MKVGDKVYCIKNLKHYGLTFFIKGKLYTINETRYKNIRILDEVSGCSEFDLIEPNENKYTFDDHFITLKEYRKLKLNKIYETI